MSCLRFSTLCLVSKVERRALKIDFDPERTLIVGMNHGGKSAILKSLYSSLGGEPHKVDKSWKDAEVASVLHFSVDGDRYTAVRRDKKFSVFGADSKRELETEGLRHLAPYMAKLLDFKLVLTHKHAADITSSPSCIFAPFYIDQDHGWQQTWTSFTDLPMFKGAAKSLSEYHSGLRPKQYYEAKAEKERLNRLKNEKSVDKKAIEVTLAKVRDAHEGAGLSLNMSAFELETDLLLKRAQELHEEQARIRKHLSLLTEERQLWADQAALANAAISELHNEINTSALLPVDVECPMCGQHYENDLAARFDLISDKDDLTANLAHFESRVAELDSKISESRSQGDQLLVLMQRISEILAIKKQDISLKDVIEAEGRGQALIVLGERLTELDAEVADVQRQIDAADARMKELTDRRRTSEIQSFFAAAFEHNSNLLDLTISPSARPSLQGVQLGRGSAGPRGLAAYYYAFCETADKFGNGLSAPFVIDEPNQQGQDKQHLPMIMRFLFEQAPKNSQVIVAAEELIPGINAKVVDVSWRKNQVLREDLFEQISDEVRSFIG